MAYSKAEQFNEDEVMMAKIAKALSHPARIAIIKFLLKEEYCFCGDITELLPIAQATVSQHLKELKNAGLINGEIIAPKVKYCINKTNYQLAQVYFKQLFEPTVQKTCCSK